MSFSSEQIPNLTTPYPTSEVSPLLLSVARIPVITVDRAPVPTPPTPQLALAPATRGYPPARVRPGTSSARDLMCPLLTPSALFPYILLQPLKQAPPQTSPGFALADSSAWMAPLPDSQMAASSLGSKVTKSPAPELREKPLATAPGQGFIPPHTHPSQILFIYRLLPSTERVRDGAIPAAWGAEPVHKGSQMWVDAWLGGEGAAATHAGREHKDGRSTGPSDDGRGSRW